MQTKTLISGFGLKLPDKEEVTKKLKSLNTEIKVENRINLKSKKLTLDQKLAIIKDGYFCTRDFIPTNDDDVIGMIDAERVADIIFQVKNKEREK